MYIGEIRFVVPPGQMETFREVVTSLLSALRLQGRILGREFPLEDHIDAWIAYVILPDSDALDEKYDNQYIRFWVDKLLTIGSTQPIRLVRGEEATGSKAQPNAHQPTTYILYTDHASLESPLRNGTTFAGVPLYHIPPLKEEEYQSLIAWQSDYQACDGLQMNDETAVRCAIRELTRLESSLSQRGLSLRDTIYQLTGTPTYYYVMSIRGRSRRHELQRMCPSCKREWLLAEPWHGIFDFRCDSCYLLSNIAWNVR
jgi:predicted  nucleic acid-binding Zn ribbon protein